MKPSLRISPVSPAAAPDRRWPVIALSILGVLTLAMVIITNGNPVAALFPTLAAIVLYALFRAPLRVPLLACVFAVLTLENPNEPFVQGQWKSPIHVVGALVMTQIKHTIPIGALVFTGIDLALFLMFAVYFYRRFTESRVDRIGAVAIPKPIVWASWVCLGGALLPWGFGLATGGENRFALWQVQKVIYLPIVILLAQAALPRARAYLSLARVLVAASCIRSVVALLLRRAFPGVEYVTSHADSVTFAVCTCALLLDFAEHPDRRRLTRCLLVLPLVAGGMIANDRRLVWVELALALAYAFALSPWTQLKTMLVRRTLMTIPAVVVYVAAGWFYPRGIFAPVATLRSMVDSESDSSTLWRDFENFDLVTTLKHHPILGTGWGHPYELAPGIPDISKVYPLEPYVPHNSVLGVWAFTGYVGFSAIWLLPAIGCYFAARAYRYARQPRDRAAAMTVFCLVVIHMLQCYGDIGLGTYVSVFLLGPGIVIAGKLAVEVGAWPRMVASRRLEGLAPTGTGIPARPMDCSAAPGLSTQEDRNSSSRDS